MIQRELIETRINPIATPPKGAMVIAKTTGSELLGHPKMSLPTDWRGPQGSSFPLPAYRVGVYNQVYPLRSFCSDGHQTVFKLLLKIGKR